MVSIYTSEAQPLRRWVGECETCSRPVSGDAGEHARDVADVICPDCKGLVRAERIYGVVNRMTCDPRCMGAVGPICSCACGGANHCGAWSERRETVASLLANREQMRERRAEAVAERRERKAAAAKLDLDASRDAWIAAHLEAHAWITANRTENDFAGSLAAWLDSKGALTDGQTAAAERAVTRDAKRAVDQAKRAANAKDVPTGRITITGTIISTRHADPNDMYGTHKMLVEGTGWRVWGTVPRSLTDALWNSRDFRGALTSLVGRKVSLTATVTASDKDAAFGFYSRPSKAKFTDSPGVTLAENPHL